MVKLEDTLSKEEKKIIVDNFGKLTMDEISKKSGVKLRSISKFFSNRNMVLNKDQRRIVLSRRKLSKYERNHNFFSEKSNNSIYWAGFIAADGNVKDTRLRVKLKYTDKPHLEVLKLHIEYTGVIKKDCSRRLDKVHCGALLYISSNKIVTDLKKLYNITEKKSLTLEPPNIEGLEADLFILGYFDGDGTVYNKRNYKCVRFYGTKEINEWIKARVNNIYPKNSGSIYKKENIWCFELNPRASEFFIKHYGNLKCHKLERKWKIVN